MVKNFRTAAVLGVYSGRILEDMGIFGIHEVLQFFYPTITLFTGDEYIERGSAEVLRQHPYLKDLGECTEENWREWVSKAIEKIGKTMPLHEVGQERKIQKNGNQETLR